jgi:hypothetical protein
MICSRDSTSVCSLAHPAVSVAERVDHRQVEMCHCGANDDRAVSDGQRLDQFIDEARRGGRPSASAQ